MKSVCLVYESKVEKIESPLWAEMEEAQSMME